MSPFWKVTSANNSHDMLKKWTNYRLIWRAKYRNWKPNKKGRSKESKKADKIKLKLWTVDLRNLKETESKQIKSWQSTLKFTRIWTNTSKSSWRFYLQRKRAEHSLLNFGYCEAVSNKHLLIIIYLIFHAYLWIIINNKSFYKNYKYKIHYVRLRVRRRIPIRWSSGLRPTWGGRYQHKGRNGILWYRRSHTQQQNRSSHKWTLKTLCFLWRKQHQKLQSEDHEPTFNHIQQKRTNLTDCLYSQSHHST